MDVQVETNRLLKQMSDLNTSLKRGQTTKDVVSKFYDFSRDGKFHRGRAVIEAAAESLQPRIGADIVALKFLARGKRPIALVDGVFDTADGKRGWITEVWQLRGETYQIVASRSRVGSAERAFKALSEAPAHQAIAPGVNAERVKRETEALKARFREFRKVYNDGDGKAVTAMFTKGADAIPVFSFLDGRAQFLTGGLAIAAKADRMTAGALVSNPADADKGSQFVSGEPKQIRFLNGSIALVDGTAKISGIPKAHGYAPTSLAGVYTDVWSKKPNGWMMAGSRAWF